MLLLLQEPHLTTLFDLLEMLACFKPPSPNAEKVQENPEVGPFTLVTCFNNVDRRSAGPESNQIFLFVCAQNARCEELHLHAENLSRRVWELLMLLPTCPKMLQAFQNISDDTVSHQTAPVSPCV